MGRLKAVLLASIVGAGVIFVPKLISNDKQETEISNTDYAIYAAADNEQIGEIHIEPTVYDVLREGGYNLSGNPTLERTIHEHNFSINDRNSGRMTTDANFRKGPGIEYDIIEELKQDTPFKVLARSDNGWYLVDYQGSLGFISADYVETYNPEAIQMDINHMPRVVPGIRATTDVNIRREPNMDGEIIGVLDNTYALPAGAAGSDEWIPVSYQGQAGYVYGGLVNGHRLVENTSVVEGSWTETVDVIRDSFLYSKPYGESCGVIPQYQSARVYGEVEDYYYVDCDGQLGYVKKRDCSKTTEDYVVIDYSMKKAFLYHGNQKVLSTYVCLGKEGMETPLGCHQVLEKKRDTVLIGDDYAVPVEYFIRFYGQCGIHDADYRTVFGYDDTHGCVNVLPDIVPTFYDDLSVGDTVIVQR